MAYPYDAKNSYELHHSFPSLGAHVRRNALNQGYSNAYGTTYAHHQNSSAVNPESLWVRFNPNIAFKSGEHSGAVAEDARSVGVFGRPDDMLRIIGGFGQTEGGGGAFSDLMENQGATITGQASGEEIAALMRKVREDDFGLFGNPFKRMPPRLAQHMQKHVMGDVTKRYDQLIADIEAGKDLTLAGQEFGAIMNDALRAVEQRPAGVNLVEGNYGEFQWDGVREAESVFRDPEFQAYRDQMARRRQDLAAAHAAQRASRRQGMQQADMGSYSPIADLYASQDAGVRQPQYRSGLTPATKKGAAVYTDTPGYIGAHAADDASTRSKTALERFYEEQGM